MNIMGRKKYRNVSFPQEFIEEVESNKPSYMSNAEFIRFATKFYMDNYSATPKIELEVPILERG